MDSTYFVKKDFSGNWNSRAFGKQVGAITYVAKQFNWLELTVNKIIFTGRFLSIFYSVLLILLVFKLALLIFQDQKTALMAALFLSIFDLNITYSHYALPAISYVFWAHLSLYFTFLFYKKMLTEKTSKHSFYVFLLVLPLPFSMTFATKFDFLPLAMFFLLLSILFFRKKITFLKSFGIGIWMLSGGLFYYLLAHGFDLNFAEAQRSFTVAKDLNENVVPKDQHWLHNPIVYFLAIIGGSSLLAMLSATVSTVSIFMRKSFNKIDRERLFYIAFFLLFLALELVVRWRMDTAFVRRANIFLPFVALMAAYGFKLFLDNNRIGKGFRVALIVFAFLYTTGIAFSSQYNFWNDTRYQSRAYINEKIGAQEKIKYSMYAKVKGTPKENVKKFEEADFLILHEAYYSRYWKSFTTPFKIPECCEEVYHCHGKSTCEFFQDVLAGKSDYELLEIFPTLEVFPERQLYKRYFGSYETFLGDVRIYRRVEQ